jgi:hypothetical protein
MTPSPTLDYATPSLRRGEISPAVILLDILAGLYGCAIVAFVIVHLFGFRFGILLDLIVSLPAVSAVLYVIAARKLRRHSHAWALIALIATLVNLAAILFLCTNLLFFTSPAPRLRDLLTLACLPIPLSVVTLHIVLVVLLFTLLRHFRKPP